MLVLALAGCGSEGDDGHPESVTTEAPEGEDGPLPEDSAWAQVLSAIGEHGTVDADTAMAAFALAFGPAPGVTVPEGLTGGVVSGSGPLRWAVAARDDLPAGQREAVDAVLAETDEAVLQEANHDDRPRRNQRDLTLPALHGGRRRPADGHHPHRCRRRGLRHRDDQPVGHLRLRTAPARRRGGRPPA